MEHRAGYVAACGRPGRGCGGLQGGWGLRGPARPGRGRKQAVRHHDPPRIPGTCGTLAPEGRTANAGPAAPLGTWSVSLSHLRFDRCRSVRGT
jgi:hypothetical protein